MTPSIASDAPAGSPALGVEQQGAVLAEQQIAGTASSKLVFTDWRMT